MTRWIALVLWLAGSPLAYSATYFVSNDGNDRNDGRSAGRPWRTLQKVNSSFGRLQPGDVVLFRRGDRFGGSLVISKSGVAGRPIRIGAYGSGPRPILDGFHRLSGWRSMGGHRWQASFAAPEGKVPILFTNLRFRPVGRYPNADQSNGGYLTINGGNGRTQFTSSALKGGPWRGAEAVIRARRWIIDRSPITQHSGQRITVKQPVSYPVEDGFGFFVVNHLNTLDREGEWAYHGWTKELFLYTKRNPNSQAIIVPRFSSLITLRDRRYVRIENLELWGSARSTIFMRNSQHVSVNNCRLFGNGQNAITLEYSKNVTLTHNTFSYTNSTGVLVEQGSAYTEIGHNSFEYTGLVAGMGKNGDHSYNAIRGKTRHLNVHHNRINGVGHNGVSFVGDHINVQYNHIRNFCRVKDDGAGIYGGRAITDNATVIQIKNNIVGEGRPPGINNGTPYQNVIHVNGIYLDQRNNNVTIEDNTLYGCGYFGMFLHNVRDARVTRNVMYDNLRALGLLHSARGDRPMRGINFQNNELFARQASQELMQVASAHNDHFRLGTLNYNYYYTPLKREQTIRLSDGNYKPTFYNVAQWKAASPYDQATRTNPRQWPTFEISRYLSSNLLPNALFSSGLQSWQVWSSQGNGLIRHGNGTMDGGSLVMQFSGGNKAGNSKMTVSPSRGMGAVRQGQRYVLRYHTKSNGSNEELAAKITTRRGAFQLASNVHATSTTPERRRVETFFTINRSLSDALLKFDVAQNGQQIHLDNVELRRVQTRWVDYNRYVQFVTNPSTRRKSVPLPAGRWRTLRGQTHQGSVSLEPFRSLILVNDNAGATQRTSEMVAKAETSDSVATAEAIALRVGAFPNPLLEGDDLTVAVQVPDGPAEVQMYDADGKLLWHDTLVESTDLRFPRATLGTPGLRLIKVTTDTSEVSEKVIIR